MALKAPRCRNGAAPSAIPSSSESVSRAIPRKWWHHRRPGCKPRHGQPTWRKTCYRHTHTARRPQKGTHRYNIGTLEQQGGHTGHTAHELSSKSEPSSLNDVHSCPSGPLPLDGRAAAAVPLQTEEPPPPPRPPPHSRSLESCICGSPFVRSAKNLGVPSHKERIIYQPDLARTSAATRTQPQTHARYMTKTQRLAGRGLRGNSGLSQQHRFNITAVPRRKSIQEKHDLRAGAITDNPAPRHSLHEPLRLEIRSYPRFGPPDNCPRCLHAPPRSVRRGFGHRAGVSACRPKSARHKRRQCGDG